MLIIKNKDILDYLNEGTIGIPTNGFITRNGSGVMGDGLAKQAKDRFPGIEYDLGRLLKTEGNQIGWIRRRTFLKVEQVEQENLIAIPVKPCSLKISTEEQKEFIIPRMRDSYKIGDCVPGFHCMADLFIIMRSLEQLIRFIEKHSLERVFIPLLGCGNGGLSATNDLFPLLDQMKIPDSVTLVFKEE